MKQEWEVTKNMTKKGNTDPLEHILTKEKNNIS